MVRDAGLLGLAIVLTLAAGFGLSYFESYATDRGWRFNRVNRPGGVALLFGAGVAGLVGGLVDGHEFVLVAGAVAGLSGLPQLRTGGRLTSFLILWVGAVLVVLALDAEIVAFGQRAGDVVFTAFLLSCFASVIREWDAASSFGWAASVAFAAAMTAMCVLVDRPDDRTAGVLVTGAIFGTIAVSPFGAGMLGRVGSRFAGLAVGAMAIRAAAGSPNAAIAVAVAALVGFVLWLTTIDRNFRRRAWGITAGAVVLFGVASVPAALALLDVYEPLNRAVGTSRRLVRTNPAADLPTTTQQLAAVQQTFRQSSDKLSSPAASAGRFVPFVGANLRAAAVSARSAAGLADSASKLLAQVNVSSISVQQATIAQSELDRLADALRGVQVVVLRAEADIAAGGATDLLVPQLRDGVADLSTQLGSVERRVRVSLDGTVAAKRLLGYDRPRRFFIAVQNNAESRATGGYVANYGILEASEGKLTLSEFKRTSLFDDAKNKPRTLRAPRDFSRRYSRFDVDRNWTNVNLSPDFPTVARIMADQYKQFSGNTVDGVLALDPIALARFLNLTGPVRVPGWPVPITAKNAVAITLHDEYVAFDSRPLAQRVDFVGLVAKTVFERVTDTGLTDLKRAGNLVRDLTLERHMQFWSWDPLAERFFYATSADGHVRPTSGDVVMLTTQNAGGNKLDYFLQRSQRYEANVERVRGGLKVSGTYTVTLKNSAPSSGEPRYVIGPFDSRFKAGQNRMFVSLYSPRDFALESATIDGQPLDLLAAPELGYLARSAFVDVPAGATRTIEIRLTGVLPNSSGRYRLDVFHQPTVYDDNLELVLHGVGDGARYAQNGLLTRDLRLDLATRN